MVASWNDIEHAVDNDAIESLDKTTLEEFLKVKPPNNNNPGLIAQWQDARQRISRRLAQIESNEQEQREVARYKKNIFVAVLTLLFAAIAAWPVIREWTRSSSIASPTQVIQSSQSGSTPSKLTQPKNQLPDKGCR